MGLGLATCDETQKAGIDLRGIAITGTPPVSEC